jgi:hypothetical protein
MVLDRGGINKMDIGAPGTHITPKMEYICTWYIYNNVVAHASQFEAAGNDNWLISDDNKNCF